MRASHSLTGRRHAHRQDVGSGPLAASFGARERQRRRRDVAARRRPAATPSKRSASSGRKTHQRAELRPEQAWPGRTNHDDVHALRTAPRGIGFLALPVRPLCRRNEEHPKAGWGPWTPAWRSVTQFGDGDCGAVSVGVARAPAAARGETRRIDTDPGERTDLRVPCCRAKTRKIAETATMEHCTSVRFRALPRPKSRCAPTMAVGGCAGKAHATAAARAYGCIAPLLLVLHP